MCSDACLIPCQDGEDNPWNFLTHTQANFGPVIFHSKHMVELSSSQTNTETNLVAQLEDLCHSYIWPEMSS